MDAGIFTEISLILVIATVIAGITQLLKQPLIIGHIFTGILVGPFLFNLVKSTETVELFSHIGVAFLLFIIGIGLNPKVIKEVGKISLFTGLGQIFFTSILGFSIATLLGFAAIPALYIAVALTFSSTIIILKILSDKKETHQLYGKIATGFLLVQDLVAVTLLILITSVFAGDSNNTVILLTLLKGVGAALLIAGFARWILPKLTEFLAKSQEVLYTFAIGWGLGIAALFAGLGFSIEIGALAAGVALAGSRFSYEISSRLRPLRDFFLILFFIVLGAGMSFDNITASVIPALIFSAFILIGNPFIVLAIMGSMGYSKKTGFKAGLTVAQISEFSLILVVLGHRIGQLPADVVSMVTLVGLITIAGSTYMMLYDDWLYSHLQPVLRFFERKKLRSEKATDPIYEVILFGYEAGGHGFLTALQKLGRPYLVVDYNPEIVDHLKNRGIPLLYGDANDREFLEDLNLEKAKLIVINITDFAANALIVEATRSVNPRAIILAMTKADDKVEEALDLYERGASYVMMPRYLSSLKVGNLIRRYELSSAKFREERDKHKQVLHTVKSN